MFNLDPGKLLVIAVVAIILLGPDRLPQVARQVGAAWRSFNEFRHRMESEVRSSMPDLPSTSEIARLARSPSALLNHLSTMSEDGTEEQTGEASTDAAVEATGAVEATSAVEATANGSRAHPGDNGTDGTARAAEAPPAEPRYPQTPVPPMPETVVPADPSLN
jgi:sec-independent protein translocase protein TatB